MKKILFVTIVLMLALLTFILTPDDNENVVKPYQDADSQLLIPQRNVVIVTIDLDASKISFFNEETITILENLNNDFIDITGVTQVDSILNANTVRSDEFEIYINPIIPDKSKRTAGFFNELAEAIDEHTELKPYINSSKDSLLFYIYFGYKVSPSDMDSSLMELREKSLEALFEILFLSIFTKLNSN